MRQTITDASGSPGCVGRSTENKFSCATHVNPEVMFLYGDGVTIRVLPVYLVI